MEPPFTHEILVAEMKKVMALVGPCFFIGYDKMMDDPLSRKVLESAKRDARNALAEWQLANVTR